MPLSHINLPAGLCTPSRTHSAQSISAPPWLPTALGVRPNSFTLPRGVYTRGSGGITPSTAGRKEGFINTCGMKGWTALKLSRVICLGQGVDLLHFGSEELGLGRGGVWGPASFTPGSCFRHLPSHLLLPTFLPYLPKLPFSGSGSRAVLLRKGSLSAHLTRLWSSIFASSGLC